MILLGLGAAGPTASAAEPADTTTTTQLDDFVIVSDAATRRKMGGVTNTERIGQVELCRAVRCNLGESFSTSPSVDVNYSDAATGAKQIKLLGLPGTYVQLLTENMLPAFRGAASPYALRYVPGNTWMKSIQVSKGVASVKNGYEAMTGQIDIEYLKPQDLARREPERLLRLQPQAGAERRRQLAHHRQAQHRSAGAFRERMGDA